jgi:peptidoglycan/LPS O-acetylase OafA/YrhL
LATLSTTSPSVAEAVRVGIEPARDRSIDIARLAAAFLIVLFHAAESYTMAGGPPIAGSEPWVIVGDLSLWGRVPFFFFLSGCFAARSLVKPDVTTGSFIGKRLKVLGIPYLFWNAVCLIMLFFALRAGASLGGVPTLDAASGLGKLTGIGTVPANGPLWFIRDLILVSCLAPLLLRLGPWLLVPSVALIIVPEISQELLAAGCPRPSSLGYFGIGMLLSYLPKGTLARLFPKPGVGVLLCFGLGVIHAIWHLAPSRFAGVSIGAMGILLVGCFIHRSYPGVAAFLSRHANASFIVFAANVPFFAVARFIYPRVQGHVPPLAYFSTLAVIFFALALWGHHLVRERAPRLLTLISGGR